jgi:hypothetical protein
MQTQTDIVCVALRNGLGNRIFQVLAGLAYAEKHKKTLCICRAFIHPGFRPHEQNLDGYLLRIFPDLKYIDTFSNYTTIQEKQYFKYDTLPKVPGNVLLTGYFQCPLYFPSRSLLPVIRTTSYPNTFFVHVRGGDYLEHQGEWGFDVVSYYKKCFDKLRSRQNVKYLVFSNDNKYADNMMKQFNITYTISDKEDPVDSLIEMANCEGGICVNSTFGWLGGFFQGTKMGQIFMPSIWNNAHDCKGVYPSWATIIKAEIIRLIQPEKVFITFGAGECNFKEAVTRIVSQARSINIFDRIIEYSDIYLKKDKDFWDIHSDFIENNKRGYGYWLWKPYIIKKTMDTMKDGDILLYLDSGCEINIYKKKQLLILMDIVKTEKLIGSIISVENAWNKMDLLVSLDMLDTKFLNSPQHQAGAILLSISNETRQLINTWYKIACNYHFIDDSPSISPNLITFREHRHDQSIFSLLTKKYNIFSKCDIRSAIEYAWNRSGISKIPQIS